MIDSTNPRIMANNIQELAGRSSGGTVVVANPEGTPTGSLESIQIGENIYSTESGIAYSNTEKEVGKWIDDSTLYEKTISYRGAISSTGYEKIAELGSAVEVVIFVAYSNTNSAQTNTCYTSSDTTYLRVERATGDVYMSAASSWSDSQVYVCIRYTKPVPANNAKKRTVKKEVNE